MGNASNRDIAELSCREQDGSLHIKLAGKLSSTSIGDVWGKLLNRLRKGKWDKVEVDAAEVEYCDVSGATMFVDIKNRLEARGIDFEIKELDKEFQNLIALIETKPLETEKSKIGFKPLVKKTGKFCLLLFKDMVELINYLGEITAAIIFMIFHPRRVRWKDFFLAGESAGANAIGIISMLGFLMGLILAFQSAIPLKRFGAELYVADLVSVSVIRELGPLITAIILAGRTGTAFAAELGTMKVNEEIDALTTMGIDPVRFLSVTRITACVIVTPILTLFANLFALIGCGLVMISLGFSFETFLDRAEYIIEMSDFVGGMVKSVVFGFLVAAVGCLRGFQTKTGAVAVGQAATRAVVSGIVMIVIADGIFAVLFYYLGI